MTALPLIVTDHALIRYIERCYGLDLTSVRTEIARKAEGAAAVGASTITIDGCLFCICENDRGQTFLTTVLAPHMRKERAARGKMHRRKKAA